MKKIKLLNKSYIKEAQKYFDEVMNLMKYIKIRKNEEETENLLITSINTIKKAIKLNPYKEEYSEKLFFLENELKKIKKENKSAENISSRIENAKKNTNLFNQKNFLPIKSVKTVNNNYFEDYMNKGIDFFNKYKSLKEEKYLLEAQKYFNKAIILDKNNNKCIYFLNEINILSKNIADDYNENGFLLLNTLNDNNITTAEVSLLKIKKYCEKSILFDSKNLQHKINLDYINNLIKQYITNSANLNEVKENTKTLAKKIDLVEIKEKSIDEIKFENINTKKEFIKSRLIEMDLTPELKTKENFEKIAKAYKGLIEIEDKEEYWKELGIIYTEISNLYSIDISQQLYFKEQAQECFDELTNIDNLINNKNEILAKIYYEKGMLYFNEYEDNDESEEYELLIKSQDCLKKAQALDKSQKMYINKLSLPTNKLQEIAEDLANNAMELFQDSKDLDSLNDAKEYLMSAINLINESMEYQNNLNLINCQIAKIYFEKGLTLYNEQKGECENEELLFKIKQYYLNAFILDSNENYKNNINFIENKLENISKNYFEQGYIFFKEKDRYNLIKAKKCIEDAIRIDRKNKKYLHTLFNNPFNKEYAIVLEKINEELNVNNNDYSLPKIDVSVTEKSYETTIRIGHEKLRKELLKKYGVCYICGINIENLLVASHIKPWKKSNDDEKLDYNNVLLLCNKHDSLFDKGYISFDEEKMLISSQIDETNKKLLNLSDKDKLNIKLTESMKSYLKWHFENIFKQ